MPKNHSNLPSSQNVVLPLYTLDSPLVLLPGIIYNASFSRFKAAAFFARYREKIGAVPIVKSVLAEYDFDTADAETPHLSQRAFDGIGQFHSAETKIRLQSPNDADIESQPSIDLDWLVVAVSPNFSRIVTHETVSEIDTDSQIATVCRVVGISDDSNTVRLTLQAIVRAQKVNVAEKLSKTEANFSILWSEHTNNVKKHVDVLKTSTGHLFKLIDSFVEKYRDALTSQGKNLNLLTLDPLANALFLQLAGLKDFEKAYATLQRICDSGNTAESTRRLLRIIDLTMAVVPFPNTEKVKILSILSLESRATEANTMIEKMAHIFDTIKENNVMANHWFHNEASKMQKANLVANQLKSIRAILEGLAKNSNSTQTHQKQLVRRRHNGPVPVPPAKMSSSDGSQGNDNESHDDDDDDDLRALTDFIKNQLPKITSISEDSKRLLVKDFRRIKNSPPGNADFHVLRNYLEIVADMPWDKYVARFKSNKDIDITEAKTRLDEDHYGLQHVKTRLIQYLVVLKLLGANAEKEYNDAGVKEAERRRNLRKQMETRKFTRESTNGESIIVPNSEEARAMRDQDDAADGGDESSSVSEESKRSHKALLASKNNKSPIIMLAGPPGVGKTSLAKSIAATLGRKFQRISLGGVRDESEIRGHRRTYIGAMAGSIVQALRKSRSMNPVILLDEIDKVVGGHNSANKVNGDPAAALLEVLDPEQNTQFVDHYLGFPIDLSQVIFICTANDPYNLSRPLLDRLEMIEVGAYDYNEKLVIGKRYLLPRQMKRNGFVSDQLVVIEEPVMKKVILDYTREAGVRNLERKLGAICRFKAVEYSESLADTSKSYEARVEEFDLAKYLGLPSPSLSNEIVDMPILSSRFGVVNGMSYNTDGSGSVLIFESIGFHNDKGGTSLNMTGRLGDVLMESGKIGLTFIKNTLYKHLLNVEDPEDILKKLNNMEIHMHVPSGAVQKDGPSAGITMALLFLSLILEKPVPSNIAMTGEITLRGLVLPIGGLKEKILGAHLTGQIDKVIVPRDNRRDVLEEYVHRINDSSRLNELLKDNKNANYKDSSPEDYFADKYGVRVVYAKEFWDVVKHVWGDELLVKVEHSRIEEYHL